MSLQKLTGALILICSLDKMKQKSEKNWPRKHATYINDFKAKVAIIDYQMQHGGLPVEHPHSDEPFNEYLVWLRANTRLKLNTMPFCTVDIVEASNHGFDKMGKMEYNKLIREGRRQNLAPVINFVVSLSYFYICAWIEQKSNIYCWFASNLRCPNM